MIDDIIAIVKGSTKDEYGIRLRQSVKKEGLKEWVNIASFSIEEIDSKDNIITTIEIAVKNIPELIEALYAFKEDKRRKRRIIRAEIVS